MLSRLFDEVSAVLIEHVISIFGIFAVYALISAHARHGLHKSVLFDRKLLQESLYRRIGFFRQAEEEVFHGHIAVPHLRRLFFRGVQSLRQSGREILFRTAHFYATGNFSLRRRAQSFQIDLHFFQKLGNQSLVRRDQSVKKMHLPYFLIAVFFRDALRLLQSRHGFFRKFPHIHNFCLPFRSRRNFLFSLYF